MTKALYSEEDNVSLEKALENVTKINSNIIPEEGAVVLGNNATNMFNNIKDIFANENNESKKFTNFFTTGKGKVKYSLDGTVFSPETIVLLAGKRFEERYVKQLEKFIFTDKEELDPDRLIHLIFLVDFIKKGNYPIGITTGKHKHLLPKMVKALDTFFNKNYSVLSSIHVMFTGMSNIKQQPVEEVENDERRE